MYLGTLLEAQEGLWRKKICNNFPVFRKFLA
jgi:hypothetical protein